MRYAAIFILCLFMAFPALACECPIESHDVNASRNNIHRAKLILDATVLKVEPHEAGEQFIPGAAPPDNPNYSKVTLEPHTFYKGEGEGQITIYVDTVTSCGGTIIEGESRLFLLDDYMGHLITAGMCGNFLAETDRKALRDGKFNFDYVPTK